MTFTKTSCRLLSIEKDPKTVKGRKRGFLTGILYLAPANESGFQVCPKATDACTALCLYNVGNGHYPNVRTGRLNKTRWFHLDRDTFMEKLVGDIEFLARKAMKNSLEPVVRLNGTSDLPWEKIRCERGGKIFRNVMHAFPEIQFYDYTKIPNRRSATLIPNYHLTFSLSESNDTEAREALANGMNVAVVMKLLRDDPKPTTWNGFPVIDGDEHDVRSLDPKGGHIVALFGKGMKTRSDESGFIRDPKDTAWLDDSDAAAIAA